MQTHLLKLEPPYRFVFDEEIGLALVLKGEPLEYKSLYQSVQKGINAHPALPMTYKKWTEYQIKDGERASTFLRQKAVADRLMEILRERKILLSK